MVYTSLSTFCFKNYIKNGKVSLKKKKGNAADVVRASKHQLLRFACDVVLEALVLGAAGL